MKTTPDNIFAEDSEFFIGISEELGHSDLLPMYEEDELHPEPNVEYEFIDDSLTDIDFSEFTGDYKSSLKKLDKHLKKSPHRPKKIVKRKKPLNKNIGVKRQGVTTLHGKNGNPKTASRIMIPRDRHVTVEGVDKFILSGDAAADSYKNIGYYKGEKLKELNLTFNNNSSLDFTLELFNPSMQLDYLFSTSINLNNRISIAGGQISYSDVMFNILANPPIIPSARVIISGPSAAAVAAQREINLGFKIKNIKGEQYVNPLNIGQNFDTMQYQSTVVNFDILSGLGRMYIPDGMDVASYTVLAGNTVTLCFYYKQKHIKELLWPEAKSGVKIKMII